MASTNNPYGDPETRNRILDETWKLVTEKGAAPKLSEVASRASVSRQAVYLHFGDRSGLLVALVQFMDQTLDLSRSLEAVHAAPDGASLIEAAMRLNTTFWQQVLPVAQVLETARHDDEALRSAWRDRMNYRQSTFAGIVGALAERDELHNSWTVEDATATLYAVAHFDTWRELVIELNWTDEQYVDSMTRLLRRALLR